MPLDQRPSGSSPAGAGGDDLSLQLLQKLLGAPGAAPRPISASEQVRAEAQRVVLVCVSRDRHSDNPPSPARRKVEIPRGESSRTMAQTSGDRS
jgi:hypothetical protein